MEQVEQPHKYRAFLFHVPKNEYGTHGTEHENASPVPPKNMPETDRFQRKKSRASTTREIHAITRETLNAKMQEIATPEVRDKQRAQLTTTLKTVKRQGATKTYVDMDSAWKAALRAAVRSFERKSMVHSHEIIAKALNRNSGFIDLAALRRYITSARNGIVRLTRNDKSPLESSQRASRRGLRLERHTIAFVKERKKFLHQDEDENFRRSMKNPLTAIALRYARTAAYGIDYGGDYENDFQQKDNFQPKDNFQLPVHDFMPGNVKGENTNALYI
jgi:hypothetical protein